MTIEFVSIPVIAAIVGGLMEAYKLYIAKGREGWIKAIPIIGIILGMGIGVLCFFAFPTIVPATTWVAALFMGAASGATATGVHQIFKQYAKKAEEITGIEIKIEDKPEVKIESKQDKETK